MTYFVGRNNIDLLNPAIGMRVLPSMIVRQVEPLRNNSRSRFALIRVKEPQADPEIKVGKFDLKPGMELTIVSTTLIEGVPSRTINKSPIISNIKNFVTLSL